MKSSGRLAAAIEVLTDFETRRVPLKTAMGDWGRQNRIAGAKDRAWISGLCLDVLRKRRSLSAQMGDDSARAAALAALKSIWGMSADEIEEVASEEPHGIGALTPAEKNGLAGDPPASVTAEIAGDYPDWLSPHIQRVFGSEAAAIMQAFTARADVDLRMNTLKASTDQSLKALAKIKGEDAPVLVTGARVPAPPAQERAAAVTVIPAFNKGWVEVQDIGSQIAASGAGDIKGKQVLDYCAGGGGKTLALSALMDNTGQLYAYDRDPRRLKPLFHRAKRAGLRNLQVRSPAGNEGMDDLEGKMDVVFVDAPCTGAGTWRRHPDTKWRLTDKQLETRMREQDQVLAQAAHYVRPGGRLVWVTCSFLMEENEDRLAAFLEASPEFTRQRAIDAITQSKLLRENGAEVLANCETSLGDLRLTPDKIRTDGFFICVLGRKA